MVSASAKKRGPLGFVEEDNSGKSNIFAVEPKSLYLSSPRSDAAAQQGLGGRQGLVLVGGLIGLVLLITAGLSKAPEDNLEQVAGGLGAGDSLVRIAMQLTLLVDSSFSLRFIVARRNEFKLIEPLGHSPPLLYFQ